MSNKDAPRRERKKLKKEGKKGVALSPITTTPSVEVVPKGKPAKEPRE